MGQGPEHSRWMEAVAGGLEAMESYAKQQMEVITKQLEQRRMGMSYFEQEQRMPKPWHKPKGEVEENVVDVNEMELEWSYFKDEVEESVGDLNEKENGLNYSQGLELVKY